ncbi:RsiG family protein [Nocardioides mangrovi]|uniref:RsiG-like domain-containing protein n=1 Tax=Nocardioides mangrovi TaxID=2874580 RepID=A0ABS7UG93_9ACTN|nr:hypothetical protein [Nocardioides mangrovi]MBZ5740026.1 hypothetical protein [Nocardioides mangrovi]MBZ5740803.1 hypothetical protein [Nocardioides mangrovi]
MSISDDPRLGGTQAEAHDLAGLTLDELRGYRQRLRDEEDRISYWRRLVHARIDVLDASGGVEGSLSLDDLVRVLGDTGTGRVRQALHRVRAAEPLPDLPALDEVWTVPADAASGAQARERLVAAEQQLTRYRSALHERIDAATAELVARYRQDPTRALSALPH